MTLSPEVSFEIEPVIREFIEATNREDSVALLAAFSDDALLDDWGRHFAGRERIAVWNAHENVGNRSRITVLSAVTTETGTVLQVDVSGDGYTGAGTFTVRTSGGLIERLEIRG